MNSKHPHINKSKQQISLWPLLRAMLLGITLLCTGITFWLFSRPVNSSDYSNEKPDTESFKSKCSISGLFEDQPNPYAVYPGDMPDKGCVKLKINPIGGSLGRVFNDSNYIQLQSARELGFAPITSMGKAWNLRRPIVEITSCKDFFLDSLSHSYPYLVPEAASLLHDIGKHFNQALSQRGGGQYRIKVTSLTRTPLTVNKLRRINRNATEESTHQYGTTFDISYLKFICDDSLGVRRNQEDLKNLLAEVLNDLRNEGRCYVKHERKQSCFHITARKTE